MQLLHGHISPETAYHVLDYPYGHTLRCQIRYWLEYHPKRGFRFMSQTSNPKKAHVWNKPKASTYCRFGGAMYLDDNGHVQWAGLTEYSTGAETQAYLLTYGQAGPAARQELLRKWTAAKLAYDANRNSGDPLSVGLVEARRGFING